MSFVPETIFQPVNLSLPDNPEIYNGVPVSLQLVCRRYEDEKLIGILQQVQDSIGLPFVPFP